MSHPAKNTFEAAHSAARVRELHGLPITLICDRASLREYGRFDDVRVAFIADYRDKLRMHESPTHHIVDTDILCSPGFELFDLLDQFDLALQFTEGGNHYRLPGVPVCFFEPSAGLIAWRRITQRQHFRPVADRTRQDRARAKHQGCMGSAQPRQALYSNAFRQFHWVAVMHLQTEFVCHETRMLHDRDASADMASIIDQRTGTGLAPKIGLIHHGRSSLPEYMRFALRFTIRFARRWGRLVMHRARI